ncbi:MAG: hypothetical protein LBJ20_03840 [Candidatus Methanoplasma sp.]|nr:hypothetical protein [Candidatus Methanoplasma sp.]
MKEIKERLHTKTMIPIREITKPSREDTAKKARVFGRGVLRRDSPIHRRKTKITAASLRQRLFP